MIGLNSRRPFSGKRRGSAPKKSSGVTVFRNLNSPILIQFYLDRLDYDARPGTRSPLWVAKEKTANCFEGALFAAAALRCLGHKPLVVDFAAENDDDHVVAVFRHGGLWGAVAKSNFPALRFREPVYRTLRELALSYFEFYINTKGEKSLRSYSLPFSLARFDRRNWMFTDEDLDYIGDALDAARHIPLLPARMVRRLHGVDRWLYKSIFVGTQKKGLFKAE